MALHDIKNRLQVKSIFLSEDTIGGMPAVIGYDKQFRWSWFATQLNTFIVAVDYGETPVTVEALERVLSESFAYARQNYSGWPRGFQSALGAIAILASSNVDDAAISYCRELKAGKKWAGFSVPVVIDASDGQVHAFDKKPMWGSIYYPYFKQTIDALTG